jgi:hypothetical protein
LLGIPYETVPVNLLKGEQLESAEFGAVNPARGVPVVEIDGLRISQSIAIIEWVRYGWNHRLFGYILVVILADMDEYWWSYSHFGEFLNFWIFFFVFFFDFFEGGRDWWAQDQPVDRYYRVSGVSLESPSLELHFGGNFSWYGWILMELQPFWWIFEFLNFFFCVFYLDFFEGGGDWWAQDQPVDRYYRVSEVSLESPSLELHFGGKFSWFGGVLMELWLFLWIFDFLKNLKMIFLIFFFEGGGDWWVEDQPVYNYYKIF